MYYVYVLQSLKDENYLYIGYTSDLKERFKNHNLGKIRSTISRGPYSLIYYEAYKSETDARQREVHLKTHQQRDLLKQRVKNSLLK